jgi:NADH:ubiquinone oxidoreductase subunit 6 (subunit J)
MEAHMLVKGSDSKQRDWWSWKVLMLIGAAIAGLLILSLFLEMIASSPKRKDDHTPDATSAE